MNRSEITGNYCQRLTPGTSDTDNRSQRNSRMVRSVMSAFLTSVLLILGVLALSGSASADPLVNMQIIPPKTTDQPRPVAHIESVGYSLAPGFCIFGTHHGKGSGCRGGSVNDGNECLVGRVPSSIGSAGPCFGPNFNWGAVRHRAGNCLKDSTYGGLTGAFGGGVRGALTEGAKVAARDVAIEGAAGACAYGAAKN
jgi:hypothetical protein